MTGRTCLHEDEDEPNAGLVAAAAAQPAGAPEPEPGPPPRSRGVIGLLEENCTSCMLCARECPDWCIHIESHTEPAPPGATGGRARTRPVLDRFAIDYSLCMYCGICIEVCPFDALFWSPEHAYAEGDVRDLLHERDRLREWMWTVPPPPAHDPVGEVPKELAAAESAGARPESAGRPGHRSRGPGRRPAAPEEGGAGAQPGDAPARPLDRGTAEGAAGDSGRG